MPFLSVQTSLFEPRGAVGVIATRRERAMGPAGVAAGRRAPIGPRL